MMKRYDIYAADGRELVIEEDLDGEWVKYEDAMNTLDDVMNKKMKVMTEYLKTIADHR